MAHLTQNSLLKFKKLEKMHPVAFVSQMTPMDEVVLRHILLNNHVGGEDYSSRTAFENGITEAPPYWKALQPFSARKNAFDGSDDERPRGRTRLVFKKYWKNCPKFCERGRQKCVEGNCYRREILREALKGHKSNCGYGT